MNDPFLEFLPLERFYSARKAFPLFAEELPIYQLLREPAQLSDIIDWNEYQKMAI
jgi:hypothetical protein